MSTVESYWKNVRREVAWSDLHYCKAVLPEAGGAGCCTCPRGSWWWRWRWGAGPRTRGQAWKQRRVKTKRLRTVHPMRDAERLVVQEVVRSVWIQNIY